MTGEREVLKMCSVWPGDTPTWFFSFLKTAVILNNLLGFFPISRMMLMDLSDTEDSTDVVIKLFMIDAAFLLTSCILMSYFLAFLVFFSFSGRWRPNEVGENQKLLQMYFVFKGLHRASAGFKAKCMADALSLSKQIFHAQTSWEFWSVFLQGCLLCL